MISRKSAGYRGQVWEADAVGDGSFIVKLDKAINFIGTIGFSLIVVTLDANGLSSADRVTPFLRTFVPTSSTPQYTSPLDISLDLLGSIELNVSIPNGYTPLVTLTPQTSSVACGGGNINYSTANSSLLGLIALALIPIILVLLLIIYVMRHRKQGNFITVRVAKKVDSDRPDKHPYEEDGHNLGYELNIPADKQFILGRELWLVRGKEYAFKMDESVTKDYPFYFSLSDYGGGNGFMEFLEGIQTTPAIAGQIVKFTPQPTCQRTWAIASTSLTARRKSGYPFCCAAIPRTIRSHRNLMGTI